MVPTDTLHPTRHTSALGSMAAVSAPAHPALAHLFDSYLGYDEHTHAPEGSDALLWWPVGGSALYGVIDGDVDAHCARAVAAGATVVLEPKDQDYGGRDYTVRDPEGNLWSFGSYRPKV